MVKLNSFNPVAEAYSKKVTPYRVYQYYSLIHELGLSGNEKVLDIGSGPGELSLQIAGQLTAGGMLFGIDLSQNMVRLAQRAAKTDRIKNVVFKRGDALNLELDDNSFDLVVSSNAFPWVADRGRFLREVTRVLKPGGKLGLCTLSSKCYREFASSLKNVAAEHPECYPKAKPFALVGARLYSLSELSGLVERNGLKVRRQYEFLTEEPIDAAAYMDRVNSIINENYLEYVSSERTRKTIREEIRASLKSRNGSLKITEAVIILTAVKPG